jgi:sensor histidine kinase YesM
MINNGTKIEEDKLTEINENLSSEEVSSTGNNIGIKNVYSRLKYYYGNRFKMRIYNNEEAGITVRIDILKVA